MLGRRKSFRRHPRGRRSRDKPEVIILEDRIFSGAPLAEARAEFAAVAPPVILIAAYERQGEVGRMIAAGKWNSRQARTNGRPSQPVSSSEEGILGNAELLLAHSDRLPAAETQRIRTVVELAGRLRETLRRVSNAWETQLHSNPG